MTDSSCSNGSDTNSIGSSSISSVGSISSRRLLMREPKNHNDTIIPKLPPTAISIVNDEDENDIQTSTFKGTLKEAEHFLKHGFDGPQQKNQCGSSYLYRLEMQECPKTIGQITHLLSQILPPHDNLVQIYAVGDYFMVTTFWKETLQTLLHRLQAQRRQHWLLQQDSGGGARTTKQGPMGRSSLASSLKLFKRHKNSHNSHLKVSPEPIHPRWNVWHHIALPVTRALLHLHQHSVTLGGSMDLTTIVLGRTTTMMTNDTSTEETPSRTTTAGDNIPHVYLRDFSRARNVATATATNAVGSDHLDEEEKNDGEWSSLLFADDIYQLGLVFDELQRAQPLPWGSPSDLQMARITEECCHDDPVRRPSIRRIHKRLLEILNMYAKDLSSLSLDSRTEAIKNPTSTTTTTTMAPPPPHSTNNPSRGGGSTAHFSFLTGFADGAIRLAVSSSKNKNKKRREHTGDRSITTASTAVSSSHNNNNDSKSNRSFFGDTDSLLSTPEHPPRRVANFATNSMTENDDYDAEAGAFPEGFVVTPRSSPPRIPSLVVEEGNMEESSASSSSSCSWLLPSPTMAEI